jgi:CheY-like chemotaxis protein
MRARHLQTEGRAAVDQVRSRRPDLLILDVMNPGDGRRSPRIGDNAV